MKTRVLSGWVASLVCGVSLGGCKDDPPPPPLPAASAASASAARPEGPPSHQAPAYSDATTKRFRVELCFYGAHGLRITRDAYLASLAGKEPSPDRLPEFGSFPTLDDTATPPTASATAAGKTAPASKTAPSAKPAASGSPVIAEAVVTPGRPALMAGFDRLPYIRFLSSCTLAARDESLGKEAGDADLKKALSDFETWVAPLNRGILAAQRYYGSKQYESDKFARGASMHKELVTAFEQLDAKFAELTKAFLAWEPTLGKPSETLDKGGEVAFDVVDKARTIGALLLGEKPDGEVLKGAIAALEAARPALEAAAKEDPKAPHPREVLGRVGRVLTAATRAQASLGDRKALGSATFLVMNELAGLVEANHRALGQLLRLTGQTKPVSPVTGLRPAHDVLPGVRPDVRIRPQPVPPGATRGVERPE